MLGAKGVFAKGLYALGLDYETVVATRSLLALPGFWILAIVLREERAEHRGNAADYWLAALAGVTCYYVGATANFYALTLIDASVERALLFSYPVLVVLASAFWQRSMPGPVTLIAVVLTWVGVALTVGVFDSAEGRSDPTGVWLVLFCAATIAFYFVVSGKLTRSLGSARFTLVAMGAATAALVIHFQLRQGWQTLNLDSRQWALMLGLVVFSTVLPLYFLAEGVRRIGAVRASIVSTVGPPAAAMLAVIFLAEQISLSQAAGIALIIGGILSIELHSARGRRNPSPVVDDSRSGAGPNQ